MALRPIHICLASLSLVLASALSAAFSRGGSALASPAPILYHLHIPKIGGISFSNNALDILRPHGIQQLSQEGCFSVQDSRPNIVGTILLLRNPQKHVVSMYDFCKSVFVEGYRKAVSSGPELPEHFEGYLSFWRQMQRNGSWHGDFTPSAELVNGPLDKGFASEAMVRAVRLPAWGMPPFSPEHTVLHARDWPQLDGGGTVWHFTKVPFQCYVPISFQTQRLSCEKAMEWSQEPQLELALKNLEKAKFVGILEQYQASICLLQLHLGESLPSYCDCRDAEAWEKFPYKELNVNEGKKTDVKSLSNETMGEVDKLVEADWQLYRAGWERFQREVAEAERKHSTKLLCNASPP